MTSTTEHPASTHSKRRARLTVALILLALAGVTTYTSQHRERVKASDTTQWLPVQFQPLESQFGLVGRIEAATRQTLSAPFEGIVQQLAITEGQRVERNQSLLTLDTTQLDIQLRQALAELLKAKRTVQDMQNWANGEEVARARRTLSNAELNLNDTESKLADTRLLFKRGIVARMEVEALEQQLRLQRLDLIASQAELRTARIKGQGDSRQIADMELANALARYDSLSTLLAQRELRAPFAGIILRPQKNDGPSTMVNVNEGQRVSQGTPLFELASLERITARTRVEEADLHQIHEGMSVQITGDGFSGLTLHGQVLTIGAQAIAPDAYGSSSSYEVIVAITPLTPEQQQRVRLGMSANLAVVTYIAEHGLVVPAEVLRHNKDGSTYVIYRKTLDQPPHKITVTPGKAVAQGVEVFGLEQGFVERPASEK